MKLNEAQKTALGALPVSITMWGGRPFSGMPDGVRSRTTLEALTRHGLATYSVNGTVWTWQITPAGRAALSQSLPNVRESPSPVSGGET